MFHCFQWTNFLPQNDNQVVRRPLLVLHILLNPKTPIIICKTLLKIISNLRDLEKFYLFHYLEKTKNETIFLESLTLSKSDSSRFPYHLLLPGRFDVGSFFWKCSRFKNIYFCKCWYRPTFSMSPVKRIRWTHSVIIFVKTWR